MPVSLLNADTMFPSFTEGTSSSEKIDTVMNYLYMLLEELRYTFGNLGAENFNDASLNELAVQITRPVCGRIEDVATGLTNDFEVTASSLSSRISSVDGRVSSLTQTVDGFETRIEEAEGTVSYIAQRVDSLTLSVSNGVKSSTIHLNAGSTEISSADIKFTGVVTFSDLESDETTLINGAYIKTGLIEASTISASDFYGSTFSTILNTNGAWDGEIKFYYKNMAESNLAGGIRLDDEGADSEFENKYRLFIYTNNIAGGSGRNFALKLKSYGKISIEAGDFLYLYGKNITINADSGLGTLALLGNVAVYGSLMVNGTVIS